MIHSSMHRYIRACTDTFEHASDTFENMHLIHFSASAHALSTFILSRVLSWLRDTTTHLKEN